MNTFGIRKIVCLLIIYFMDVCDAECDEYIVVLEETFCPHRYTIKPLTEPYINWENVTYPCNSTEIYRQKEKCLLEFVCVGTQLFCPTHIKTEHHEAHYNMTGPPTAEPITITTEAPDFNTSHIAVTKKPPCIVCEESNASMYDVNLIFINENGNQNSSETNKIPRNETLFCHYVEIVCGGDTNPENNSLSADSNVTYDHHHKDPAVTLKLSVNRDETSPVQPIFTGYFPKSSNDSSTNYNGNFNYLKTVSQTCPILKHVSCKQNIQLNVYIKANYIENNTITKYPNCTMETITSDNVHVQCMDISFAKHNRHIEYTPPNPPPKQEMWTCQILSSNGQHNENNKLHFIKCSNGENIITNTITSGVSSKMPNLDKNNNTNTEISIVKEKIKNVNSSLIDPKNIITFLVIENTNNCSHEISLNIDEGNIIDLDRDGNNKEKILQKKYIELVLANCIPENSSIINKKQPLAKAELIIILKNESLNASNLEKFNGTTEDKNVKQRKILRCNHPNHYTSSNATSDKTTLQCESIDLELNNITGIEVTSLSQISNSTTAIKSENKTRQDLLTWNCDILEMNYTSKEHQKNKLYFENCSNNVNINNSKKISAENNILSDGEHRNYDVTKTKDKFNDTENLSGKLKPNKDNLSQLKPKNMIKILITEKANNCSNDSHFMIDEGKIIDLDVNKNIFLQYNNIELQLSNCIYVDYPITTEIKPDLKVELAIILNSKFLTDSNLKQFNETPKYENDKQRILIRCDHSNLDLSSNATSDKTVLHCESIDLVLNNITGIEINTNENQASNKNRDTELKNNMVEGIGKNTKVNVENQKNSTLNTNKTVENNATINNKSHENNNEIVKGKEVQKNKENHQNEEKSDDKKEVKEISINQMFNRKKDIPNGLEQNSLTRVPTERETILIITLLSIICSCILMVIAWRLWPNKREYHPTPTREPPDEETAF